jgi:hypothetical protein
MNEYTRGTEAEVNGVEGLTLGVEALEERIAPSLVAVIGAAAAISFGGGCCGSCSS